MTVICGKQREAHAWAVSAATALFAWLFFAAAGTANGQEAPKRDEAAGAAQKDDRNVILDNSSYWRFYLQGGRARISYEIASKDMGKTIKESGVKKLREDVLRKLKKKDEGGDEWMKELLYPGGYENLSLFNQVTSSPPAPNWMKTDFDDRDWSRYQEPFKIGQQAYTDGTVDHYYHIKFVSFRTTAEIQDPAKAGELQLRVVYRGGLRAFWNGEEIGRGHLPVGELAPETPGEPYPSEAYYLLKGEYPEDMKPTGPRLQSIVKDELFIVPDLFDIYYNNYGKDRGKMKPTEGPGGPYWTVRTLGFNATLNAAGWDRLNALRDRVLDVKIPVKRVVKGTNLLALELRASELNPIALGWSIPWGGVAGWEHGWILSAELRASGQGGAAPAMRRPAGVQVWVEDIHHRLYSPEFCPPGKLPQEARIVGTRNGTFGAQIVVGTDHELKGLNVKVSEFKGAKSALPAAIARTLHGVPHPLWELPLMGMGKGESKPGISDACWHLLARFASNRKAVLEDRRVQDSEAKRIQFFSQLSPQPQPAIPADTCQPIWISVTVPDNAAAGKYKASVTVQADGVQAVSLPLELEVLDWRVPSPKDFLSIVALEQSPYGVARHYKVEPWSDQHFKLMEKSFELLATVGNDFLMLPVINNSELGNSKDSPVRVIRKKDGSYTLDFKALDRHLDLAIKHWGVPRVAAFIVDHPGGQVSQELGVYYTDEATGKQEFLDLSTKAPEDQRREGWRLLASGISEHMKSRGLGSLTRWGLHWDAVYDASLPPLLKEFAPEVTWIRYSHQYMPDATYTWCGTVRSSDHNLSITSRKGWKAQAINLWTPRNWNNIACCYGLSSPFAYRIGIERALVSGAPGVGRVGVDYWDSTWMNDFRWSGFAAGMTTVAMFWPGAEGAETSTQFEIFREAVQEVEARIFLEQALEKLKNPELDKEITAFLDQRIHDTLFGLVFAPHFKIEEHSSGWQVRSHKLYQYAEKVGNLLGVDFRRNTAVVSIPARGKTAIKVNLRNWTLQPRAWKAASDQPWLKPERAEGTIKEGQEELGIVADAAGLEPEKGVKGSVTLTDVPSGRAETLEVTGRVSRVFTFTGQETVLNVTCGQSDKQGFTLLNNSGAELDWKIESSVAWLKAEPAAGRLPAGRQSGVTLNFAPPDAARARHEVAVTVREAGGGQSAVNLVVHVLPPTGAAKGKPSGAATPMQDALEKERISAQVVSGRSLKEKERTLPFYEKGSNFYRYHERAGGLAVGIKSVKDNRGRSKQETERTYDKGFAVSPRAEVVCSIEGKSFSAFSAEVGFANAGRPDYRNPKMHFEIYVDGQLKAHSGLMAYGEAPKLLVVEGLQAAKEMRLVTRLSDDGGQRGVEGIWGEPAFYK